jgi:hypothetical protein
MLHVARLADAGTVPTMRWGDGTAQVRAQGSEMGAAIGPGSAAQSVAAGAGLAEGVSAGLQIACAGVQFPCPKIHDVSKAGLKGSERSNTVT